MTERSFLDTNILISADDGSDERKQATAIGLIEAGIRSRRAVLSTQVLQEYFVNATRKLGIAPAVARESIEAYQQLTTIQIEPTDILEAIDLHRLHSLSFWDGLIIQSARKSGCRVLYSEDLQDGRRFGTLRLVNPFKEGP